MSILCRKTPARISSYRRLGMNTTRENDDSPKWQRFIKRRRVKQAIILILVLLILLALFFAALLLYFDSTSPTTTSKTIENHVPSNSFPGAARSSTILVSSPLLRAILCKWKWVVGVSAFLVMTVICSVLFEIFVTSSSLGDSNSSSSSGLVEPSRILPENGNLQESPENTMPLIVVLSTVLLGIVAVGVCIYCKCKWCRQQQIQEYPIVYDHLINVHATNPTIVSVKQFPRQVLSVYRRPPSPDVSFVERDDDDEGD